MRISRNRKTPTIAAIIGGVLIVGFFTWLIISLINQKTDLIVINQVEIPEFSSLEGQFNISDADYAIAINGETVYDSSTTPHPTASTAKMILGLAVLQAKPFNKGLPGETITITPEYYDRYLWYVDNNGSNTAVQIDEEISEHDALVSVFLASSNNMADTLAMWAFGSLDNYREYATNMLNEWGINETIIGVDASGFDASTTSTTSDLAKIGQKVLENPVLAEIVETESSTVPVAGLLTNTNQLLGVSGIIGIKTGFIGDASGYCLVTGYLTGEHIITVALMGAPNREASFSDSLAIVQKAQELLAEQPLVHAGDIVGYYDSWWTGPVAIKAKQDLSVIGWAGATTKTELEMNNQTGILQTTIGKTEYITSVAAGEYAPEPSFGDRLKHLFGWQKDPNSVIDTTDQTEDPNPDAAEANPETDSASTVFTNAPSDNCTIKYGALMLINPNFTVENDFISARRNELISLSATYGINEHNSYNGDNLLDAEAAAKINAMIKAYEADNPGHTMETMSCFRSVGTDCGRLCAATGTSDHHTGLTCDLIDPTYGTSLDTSTYDSHPDWQWLKANSYKYGFIDRFPEAWAGGSMDEPINVDASGSTGLFETWHYRYVGIEPATEIATGKYNNGQYDSLEHYLLSRNLVSDLKNGRCQ